MITAPYNFVPLNDKIFYPPWASEAVLKNIHDIPFEDGESGEIEIEITTKSPIFIKDSKNPSEFCHFINKNGGKEYYIPATSIKGMIRNVLEIMSFGKIRIDEGKHKKYLSVRDMTPDMDFLVGKAKGCGFLVKNDNGYMIEDCGEPLTINYDNMENFKSFAYKQGAAKNKYEKCGVSREIKFSTGNRDITMTRTDKNPHKTGTIVFTGDIGNKKHEFIFAKNGNKIPLDKNIFDDFKKVYFDNEESIDGQYWKNKFNNGNGKGIPIFYKKDGDKITAIGLTQLFKLAYKKTIFEAAKQANDEAKFDLAEVIFGAVKGGKALKGRVYFSHFKSTTERFENLSNKEGVFGTPNPSYYPNYIEQKYEECVTLKDRKYATLKDGKYVTLMDETAKIRGYKRYPLHSGVEKLSVGNNNEKMMVKFKPLPANTVFKGKIVFHNLKKVEIGALLSTITFHGRSDKFMHNIGFAKPYGYGKIDIKLTLKDLDHSQDEYLKEFEEQMKEFVPNWLHTKQLTELCEMASLKYEQSGHLRYQKLGDSKNGGKNEFTKAKKSKKSLLPYSVINNSGTKSQNDKSGDIETNGIDINGLIKFTRDKK